jgi:TusA-related sulfurtransferase
MGGALAEMSPDGSDEEMVLRGVRCPLNWARAKVRLEEMPVGSRLRLVVDDFRAVRDIPRAAEAHGYAVLEVVPLADGWRIEIER